MHKIIVGVILIFFFYILILFPIWAHTLWFGRVMIAYLILLNYSYLILSLPWHDQAQHGSLLRTPAQWCVWPVSFPEDGWEVNEARICSKVQLQMVDDDILKFCHVSALVQLWLLRQSCSFPFWGLNFRFRDLTEIQTIFHFLETAGKNTWNIWVCIYIHMWNCQNDGV